MKKNLKDYVIKQQKFLDKEFCNETISQLKESENNWQQHTFYNSKNIPKVEVHFRDLFPTSLGGIDLIVDAGDVEYIRVDASFRYMYYEFKNAT